MASHVVSKLSPLATTSPPETRDASAAADSASVNPTASRASANAARASARAR